MPSSSLVEVKVEVGVKVDVEVEVEVEVGVEFEVEVGVLRWWVVGRLESNAKLNSRSD